MCFESKEVCERSTEGGFGFGKCGMPIEERINTGELQYMAYAMIQPHERQFSSGFIASNESANQRPDRGGINRGHLAQIDDHVDRSGRYYGVPKCGRRSVRNRTLYLYYVHA